MTGWEWSTADIRGFLVSFGATVLGVMIVMWFDRLRRPNLKIIRGSDWVIGGRGDPAQRPATTWLRVRVEAKVLPWWLSWAYQTSVAQHTKAWITFHYYPDGRQVFEREMAGRWSESPEPIIQQLKMADRTYGMIKQSIDAVDIYPGESVHLDVAVRLSGEAECYGWTPESYLYEWKHPKWRLEKGRYIAKVRLVSCGREFKESFLIFNEGDFRLELLKK